MARRGRFARQTGGSDLSALIYSIMQQQYARTTSAMVDAYKNQTDYRGGGIPTADDVIAYLRSYASNQWVSQNDRDEVSSDIASIQRTERGRQETIMVSAINEDPANVSAIQTYMKFLQDGVNEAETTAIASENRDKLFDASKALVKALGSALGNGAMTAEQFDAQAAKVVNSYASDAPNKREVMSLAAEAKFSAQYNIQNTLLATASGQGSAAYNRQLQKFKKFLLGARSAVVSAGLGTVNANGDIVGGSNIALEIQKKIGEANAKLLTSGQAAVQEQAQTRVDNFNASTTGFLELVNNTLGSSYSSVEDLMGNQLDLNRFYQTAPASVMNSASFIGRDALLNTMFGDNTSILAARKALAPTSDAAGAKYGSLNALSKNYGRNTLVDDAAILFDEWYRVNGSARGDSILATKKNNELVTRYKNLLASYGKSISPEELTIHQRTVALMEQALKGEVPKVDGPTAWDLANPNAASYDNSTGAFQSVFGGTLKLIADDAFNAAEIASGKVQLAAIGPDGKWEYKAAVDPTDPNVLPIVDSSTGVTRLIAAVGVELASPSSLEAGKYDSMGKVYNLGNGNFVVETLSADNQMTMYARNFDPYSGKTMTYQDFQRRYTQRTVTGTSSGEVGVSQLPQFIVPGMVGDGARIAPVATRSDLVTQNIDNIISNLDANTDITPDSRERIIAAQVRNTLSAVAGTDYEADVKFKYQKYDAAIKEINAGPSFTKTQKQDAQNAFRAGERDAFKADAMAGFVFRNSPLADILTPPSAKKAVKDGLVNTTVKGGWGGR
jgi:hypothetical protein